jgi:phosphoglycerate kinase
MLKLPSLNEFELAGKRVIVSADLDVDVEAADDVRRLQVLVPTINYLLEQDVKCIILIGHKGRPEGVASESLSLKEVANKLSEILKTEVLFVNEVVGDSVREVTGKAEDGKLMMLENLRFNRREEDNDEEFAKELSGFGEVFVNEAFGSSHREHASIVGIPKYLPHAAGLHFVREVENLSQLFDNPKRPLVAVISGVKEDKLSYVEKFKDFADKILVGGKLPRFLDEDYSDPKVIVARLLPDTEDITLHSIERFEEEIAKAGTVALFGPLGKFEDEGHRQGTQRVFNAIANSSAVKIAGGGDTEKALNLLGLADKFDWVSVGGGASLDFLANKTLPGIVVLQKKNQ